MIDIRNDIEELVSKFSELASEYTAKAKEQGTQGTVAATVGLALTGLAPTLIALEPSIINSSAIIAIAGAVVSLGVALAGFSLSKKFRDDFNSQFFKSAAERLSVKKDLKNLEAELAAIEVQIAKLHILKEERSEIEHKVEEVLKDLKQN